MRSNDSKLNHVPRRSLAMNLAGVIGGISLAILLSASAVLTTPLYAQTVSGTVAGVVSDQGGAIVPGADVTVRNTATGDTRKTVTNADGIFSIPALPPGPYTVDVLAKGFAEGASSVTLTVGQVLNVNFSLKVGSASEKVEVVANESLGLETQDHELTSVMDAKTLENTPSEASYRNATFYAQTLQAGVQAGSALGDNHIGSNVSQYNMQSNQLFIAGQGFWSTSYLLDGVVDMSYFDQTATVQTPVEATQEVQIIRNSANARYDGANSLNALTKGGTETFHGRVYEYIENNALGVARGYNGGPLSELRYNSFGANAGWKVPFTHNKVFFFVDYQGYRQLQNTFKQAFVPTQAERNGDFSGDLAANAQTKQPATVIYDPTTFNATATPNGGASALQPFAYGGNKNVINPALISPLAKQYLNLVFPLPNTVSGISAGDNYGSINSRTKFTHDDWLYRGDYNISDKDHLWGAYDTNNPDIIRPEDWDNGPNSVGTQLVDTSEHNQLYGTDIYIEESHVVSPTVVNTARVGFARSINGQQFEMINNGTNYLSLFGLTGLNPPPSVWGLPQIGPSGYSGVSGSPLGATQNMYEYSEELNWVRGKHSMFAGAEWDVVDYNAFWYTGSPDGSLSANGEYTYNGSSGAAWQKPGQWVLGSISGGMPAANELADWELGDYSSTNATAGSEVGYFHQHNIMPYFQDDWRVTPKLTANLGIRYDYYSPPAEQYGHAGWLNPVTGKFTEATYLPKKFNFSPRVGFAYALNDKTTIHAGGGIYYYQYSYYDLQGMMTDPLFNTGLSSTQSSTQPVIWPSSSTAKNPNTGASPGQQEFLTLADAEGVWGQMPAPNGTFVPGSLTFAEKMPTSYSEQWNLAVQRAIGKDWLVTVDYVGSSNHHIFNYSNINLASLPGPNDTNPTSAADINSRRPFQAIAGNIMQQHMWGASNYNGLEATLQKQFNSGFSLNTNLVWGRSLDFQDSDHSISGEMGLNPHVDYGPSDFMQKIVYKASGIYELPFGKGKPFLNNGRWFENQLGGWRFSGLLTFEGGMPFNVAATDTSNTGGGIVNRGLQTCNGNSGPKTFAEYFSTSCYNNPAENTFGNERRNDIYGPHNTNLDLSGFKEFPIWENLTFQFRTDAFSALNHPLPDQPNATCCSGTYGEITGWGGARTLEFSGKILW